MSGTYRIEQCGHRHKSGEKHVCEMRCGIEMGLPDGMETLIRKTIDGLQGFGNVAMSLATVLGAEWYVYRGGSHVAIHRETGKMDKGERYVVITCEA